MSPNSHHLSEAALSSGPGWSQPSDLPTIDMKLSLTLQMVLLGFSAARCLFFSPAPRSV